MSFKVSHLKTLVVFALAAALAAGLAFLKPVPAPSGKAALRALSSSPAVKPAAPPALLAAAPAVHKASVPETPAFSEIAAGVYQVQTPAYSAALSAAHGLQYRVRDGRGATNELAVRLASVRLGGFSLFERKADALAEPPVPKGSAVIAFFHNAFFEECYEPRSDGVEQSFVINSLPESPAPLQFSFRLETTGLQPLAPRPGRSGGILFADASGKIGARYGRVMVRDAAEHALALEPQVLLDGSALSFEVPADWLRNAQFPLVVDPLVGSDFKVSPDNPTGVAQPTVCAGNNSYLVAWTDYSNGATLPVVAGAIVDQKSTVSAPFFISNDIGLPVAWRFQRIEAAFDGSVYLVVWYDQRQQGSGTGVYGAILGSDGAVLKGSDFLIASTSTTLSADPLVTYDGTKFIVAWQGTPANASGGSQIYFAKVTSDGTVSTAVSVPSSLTPVNQALQYLCSQRPGGDTLLLYQNLGETPATNRSIRIASDGSVRDPGGTALFTVFQTNTPSGYGTPIGAVFTNNEWQILSTYDQTVNSDVFLTHLSMTGVVTPPAGVFAVMGENPIGLGNQMFDVFSPAFPGASEWLFLRSEKVSTTTYHILGKRVRFDGTDLDPQPFQIDTATQGYQRSAVAAEVGGLFLAAWVDGRRGATQPADALNIAAALIDSTTAGNGGLPLLATASASPVSGEAPLTVAFDSTQSKGTYQLVKWDFGDGTTSTLVSPTHIYKSNGTYIAKLTLTNGFYSVFDSVKIIVGQGGTTGGATPIGVPLANTPPIVVGMIVKSCLIKLDFVNLNNDTATISGIYDFKTLTAGLTGQLAQIGIGSKTFTFNLDANGAYKSNAGSTPALAFVLDPKKSTFTFQLAAGNIRNEMSMLGMANGSVPNTQVNVPIELIVGSLDVTATVGTQYHATKAVNGVANYTFNKVGAAVSGDFIISTFTANESAAGVHDYMITGQLLKPGTYTPSEAGSFDISVGEFKVPIQSGSIFNHTGNLFYNQAHVMHGLKKFSINPINGNFLIILLRIPSDPTSGGTGLPLSSSGTDIVQANLNLSFRFDTKEIGTLTAGRYIYIGRTNAAAKAWKLR